MLAIQSCQLDPQAIAHLPAPLPGPVLADEELLAGIEESVSAGSGTMVSKLLELMLPRFSTCVHAPGRFMSCDSSLFQKVSPTERPPPHGIIWWLYRK